MKEIMRDTGPGGAYKAQKVLMAASVGSIFSAFIASFCCVGPLLFALLGIGGAGMLVKFEPYRPYFMAATFALLGGGFYFAYRKPKRAVVSGPECDCPAPKTNRLGKIILWVATALVAGFLAFPYLAACIFG